MIAAEHLRVRVRPGFSIAALLRGQGRKPLDILVDVSLAVAPGETLAIVGESGSGKSTVARCIVRLIDPSSGGIRLVGREISDLSRRLLQPHRKRIQIIFQDPYRSLNPRITIGETIAEGPINFAMPHADALERARELLDGFNW